MRLGILAPQPVEFNGSTHTHSLVGNVPDDYDGEMWHGFESKRPNDCAMCIEDRKIFQQSLCDKYRWSEWPL